MKYDKVKLTKQTHYGWECPSCGRINYESIEYTHEGDIVECVECNYPFEVNELIDKEN